VAVLKGHVHPVPVVGVCHATILGV
jgi:hypothetical protein